MSFYGENSGNKVQRTIIKPGTDPNKSNALPVVLVDSFDVPSSSGSTVIVAELENGKSLRAAQYLSDEPILSRATIDEAIAQYQEGNKVIDAMSSDELGEYTIRNVGFPVCVVFCFVFVLCVALFVFFFLTRLSAYTLAR